MSLSFLRDAIVKSLQERVDARVNAAVNIRPRPASTDLDAMTSDEYAMQAVDMLAEARAYGEAARVVIAEYNRMVEPEKTQAEETLAKPIRESVY